MLGARPDLIQPTKVPEPVCVCWGHALTSDLAHSVGELAGLHRGAGASRTPGTSATAQTPDEAAAYTTGQGAADCSVQLHMMAPESSSHCHSPLHEVQEASSSLTIQ